MADVVADRHSATTPTAHRQSLEQRRTFARRSMPSVGAVGLTVVMQAAEVVFKLVPGDVAGVRIANQRMPLLAWQQGARLLSVRPAACLGASIHERAGVARVLERTQRSPVQEWTPCQLTLV